MSLLTLKLKNKIDLELLISVAQRLDAEIIDISEEEQNEYQSPVEWLELLAKEGGIQSIQNPSVWQKEIRKDKVLPNRE